MRIDRRGFPPTRTGGKPGRGSVPAKGGAWSPSQAEPLPSCFTFESCELAVPLGLFPRALMDLPLSSTQNLGSLKALPLFWLRQTDGRPWR
jgi:hypothetical protein